MARSRNWTAELFFAKAALKVKDDLSGFPIFERFELVNEAVEAIAGQFYSVMANDYRKSEEVGVENDQIDLSAMRIMRTGNAVRITLEAGNTGNAGVPEPTSTEERLAFRPFAAQNKGKILYEYVGGDNLLKLAKATDVTTYANAKGKVVVHYPSMPDRVETAEDYVDLPDGPAADLAMLKLESIVAKRLGVQMKSNFQMEAAATIRNLYNTYQMTASEEEIKKKVEALS